MADGYQLPEDAIERWREYWRDASADTSWIEREHIAAVRDEINLIARRPPLAGIHRRRLRAVIR